MTDPAAPHPATSDTPDPVGFPDGAALPVVPMERFHLIDGEGAGGSTFQCDVHFSGPFDRDAFAAAHRTAAGRHPLLWAKLAGGWDDLRWEPGDAVPPLTWGDGPVDGTAALDLRGGVGMTVHGWTRPAVDPEAADPPSGEIVVPRSDERDATDRTDTAAVTVVRYTWHHAVCDARGGRQYLIDKFAVYARLTGGDVQPPPRLEPGRLADRGTAPATFGGGDAATAAKAETTGWQKVRNAWGFHVLTPRPIAAPPASTGNAVPPADAGQLVLDAPLTRSRTDALHAAAADRGVTTNDLAVAVLLRTLADWNDEFGPADPHRPSPFSTKRWRKKRLRVLIPVDLRTPADRRLPAANRITFTFLSRPLADCRDLDAMLPAVADELKQMRRTRIGLDFFHGIAASSQSPRVFRWTAELPECMTTTVLSYPGVLGGRALARRFPTRDGKLVLGDTVVERITGAPPVRKGVRAGFGVADYAGRFTISIRADRRFFDERAAGELLSRYVRGLLHCSSPADRPASAVPRTSLD